MNTVVIITGMTFTDLKNVLSFIYNGKITIASTEIDQVIAAGKILQIEGLMTASNSFNDETQVGVTLIFRYYCYRHRSTFLTHFIQVFNTLVMIADL